MQDFEVYGLDSEFGTEKLIVKGRFLQSTGSPAVQNFPVLERTHRVSDQPYQVVRLKVLSNHGHPDYTCLYRFRVHGASHA